MTENWYNIGQKGCDLMEQNTVGQRIKARRKELKMTQAALGAALNPPVKTSTISGYETGYSSPDINTIISIASALNCSVVDLIFPEMTVEQVMLQNAMLHVADNVDPLPKKGSFGTSGLQESYATYSFLRKLGYSYSLDVDSDEDEDVYMGLDENGEPMYDRVSKYMELKDARTGKRYIVPVSEWDKIEKDILKYSKFLISDYLSTKEPEKE